MSGNTSSTGSEADFEKKGPQAPVQVLDVPAHELAHKKYSLKALWHWLGDRDIHVWIMSLGEWLEALWVFSRTSGNTSLQNSAKRQKTASLLTARFHATLHVVSHPGCTDDPLPRYGRLHSHCALQRLLCDVDVGDLLPLVVGTRVLPHLGSHLVWNMDRVHVRE